MKEWFKGWSTVIPGAFLIGAILGLLLSIRFTTLPNMQDFLTDVHVNTGAIQNCIIIQATRTDKPADDIVDFCYDKVLQQLDEKEKQDGDNGTDDGSTARN